MKKKYFFLLISVILILCFQSSTIAESNLVAPFPAGSMESTLIAKIAEALSLNYAQADKTIQIDEARIEAVNRMLSEPDTFLCDTQAALMTALQGYTNEDLRVAMTPV